MKKIGYKIIKDNSGITLISLAVTIIVIIILATIGINTGITTLKSARLTQFTTQMKLMQLEVNELYEKYVNGATVETENGNEYIGKDILNIGKDLAKANQEQISEIFKSTAEGGSNILDKSGYRYFDIETIKSLNIDGIEQEFLVNVEKRSVVSYFGFKYDNDIYYTLEQLPDGLYNVGYVNLDVDKPIFDLKCDNWTNDKSNIQITNIKYDKQVKQWDIKYKIKGQDYWNTTDDISFFVDRPGTYYIKIVNGDIESDTKEIEVVRANKPDITDGMEKIMFELPEGDKKGCVIEAKNSIFNENIWYDYGNRKWANAKTQDGSMWVWIPRYAYKITYNNPNDKSAGGKIDIKFLIGTTDQYYDEEGNINTAKRATSLEEIVDTTSDYYVHPVFTDEEDLEYLNGGWDEEISGIWVAKFEAGYPTGNNEASIKSSSVKYTFPLNWVPGMEANGSNGGGAELPPRNWLDGVYKLGETAIKYPTFQPLTYSMTYISASDSYAISKVLSEEENIYGLNSATVDSHLMKNSEWGAITYLTNSKYGLNGNEMSRNNISLNSGNRKRSSDEGRSGVDSVYGVTGVTTGDKEIKERVTTIENINGVEGNNPNSDGVYIWNQIEGQKASSTANMYGIYDLNGGHWERIASYILTVHENLKDYGSIMTYEGETLKDKSTKYTTVYPHDAVKDEEKEHTNDNNAIESPENYAKNTKIFGDAIRETSANGERLTSWQGEDSYYPAWFYPFFYRGGHSWKNKGWGINGIDSVSGTFNFHRGNGFSDYNVGFRAVLINK